MKLQPGQYAGFEIVEMLGRTGIRIGAYTTWFDEDGKPERFGVPATSHPDAATQKAEINWTDQRRNR